MFLLFLNSEIIIIGIENIHVVRSCFASLRGLFYLLPAYNLNGPMRCTFFNSTNQLATGLSEGELQQSLSALRDAALLALRSLEYDVDSTGSTRYQGIYESLQNVTESVSKPRHVKWFRLLEAILRGATLACEGLLKNGQSVLIHCSDGWDRTSQIVSLVQMLIDPAARTMRGFAALVEKDWRSTGHQFAKRSGHTAEKGNMDDSQRAPIFIQVLFAIGF